MKPIDPATLDEMLERFALVLDHRKDRELAFYVIDLKQPRKPIHWTDFHRRFGNINATSYRGSIMNIADAWDRHPQRRTQHIEPY